MRNVKLLGVNNVSKSFGGLKALENVSLDIGLGEIRGIIGPNGSGKTTLVNLVTGIYGASSGRIYFLGRRIDGMRPDAIAKTGVMRTFQIPKVFQDMTVAENMLVPAFAQGLSKNEAFDRASELLDFVLLSDLKDEPAKSLSGGQSMLLQIVRGFMNKDMRLYVMDEPFAGVHQEIKGMIIKTIRKMNEERGITFMLISHEMTTVSALCGKISVLSKGELIAEGTMKEVAGSKDVIDAYLGG